MLRSVFYIAITLLTFTIGLFIAFNLSRKAEKVQITVEKMAEPKVKLQTYRDFGGFSETFIDIKQQTTKEKNEKPKSFCNDSRILPIWNGLKKDKDFREWENGFYESVDCADMLEVTEVDLNQDKQKEILLRGKNFNICSAVGNCGFWIFEKKGERYQKLLSATDYIDITEMPNQIEKVTTHGYSDVLLKGHITAGDTAYNYYKFDGKKYRENKCLVDTNVWTSGNETPERRFISCRAFYKQ